MAAFRSRIVFGWTPLPKVFDAANFGDLVLAQYGELAHFKNTCPLALNRPLILHLAELGIYRTWTAHSGKLLVGWIGFYVQPHLHYSTTLFAADDGYYLDPAFRGKGWTGYKLWATALPALKELGVKVVLGHTNASERPADPIFRRLGFGAWGTLYGKVLA